MLSGLGNGNGDVAETAGVKSVTDIAEGIDLPGWFTGEMIPGVPNGFLLLGGVIAILLVFSGRR